MIKSVLHNLITANIPTLLVKPYLNFVNTLQFFLLLEHNYNFRLGNIGLTLHNNGTEIFVVTLTQLISSIQPNFIEQSYRANFKVEALIIEGASNDDHLVTIVSSQHLHNSPAYFFKLNIEKTPLENNCNYRISSVLESLEILYKEVRRV